MSTSRHSRGSRESSVSSTGKSTSKSRCTSSDIHQKIDKYESRGIKPEPPPKAIITDATANMKWRPSALNSVNSGKSPNDPLPPLPPMPPPDSRNSDSPMSDDGSSAKADSPNAANSSDNSASPLAKCKSGAGFLHQRKNSITSLEEIAALEEQVDRLTD